MKKQRKHEMGTYDDEEEEEERKKSRMEMSCSAALRPQGNQR
jgi:hypothetical protein